MAEGRRIDSGRAGARGWRRAGGMIQAGPEPEDGGRQGD